ncbi:hypothetical protein V6N11_061902 [Hibiscus sabdariffa]|uniref:Uncharacterized protein n=1 Tax=Hibiscus sabdariffa TaxID=183260 RepID=A0ABR2N7G8_9ROSI
MWSALAVRFGIFFSEVTDHLVCILVGSRTLMSKQLLFMTDAIWSSYIVEQKAIAVLDTQNIKTISTGPADNKVEKGECSHAETYEVQLPMNRIATSLKVKDIRRIQGFP